MLQECVEIAGSHRHAPDNAVLLGATASDERVALSIYLREHDKDEPLAAPFAATTTRVRRSMAVDRSIRHRDDIGVVVDFATSLGLQVVRRDPVRRLVEVAGTAGRLQTAFCTRLHYYSDGRQTFRARTGSLFAPPDVAAVIDAVLGFDTRQAAGPKCAMEARIDATRFLRPHEIARRCRFPVSASAAGQCIGIIALGGGYRESDVRQAFVAMRRPIPPLATVLAAGGDDRPGIDHEADAELALGIQMAGGAAPGVRIVVYAAENTARGFVDAVGTAVHDADNRPSVLVVSWAAPEYQWSEHAIRAMQAALRDAARLGITVCCATGDTADGTPYFPASSPYALACGSAENVTDPDNPAPSILARRRPRVAVSRRFPRPGYQIDTMVTPEDGRLVPDVVGPPGFALGCRVVLGGIVCGMSGSSAVAPLWAALFALVNRPGRRTVGLPHFLLYADPAQRWRPAHGLGHPDGAPLFERFRRAVGAEPTRRGGSLSRALRIAEPVLRRPVERCDSRSG